MGPDNPDEEELKLGEALGDLTSELEEGEFSTDFVCCGPKSYSFRTNQGRTKVCVKGTDRTHFQYLQICTLLYIFFIIVSKFLKTIIMIFFAGITLNAKHSKAVTFETLRDMVLREGPEEISVVEPWYITRKPLCATLTSAPYAKKFRMLYTKRRLIRDEDNKYTKTLPYGWIDD